MPPNQAERVANRPGRALGTMWACSSRRTRERAFPPGVRSQVTLSDDRRPRPLSEWSCEWPPRRRRRDAGLDADDVPRLFAQQRRDIESAVPERHFGRASRATTRRERGAPGLGEQRNPAALRVVDTCHAFEMIP